MLRDTYFLLLGQWSRGTTNPQVFLGFVFLIVGLLAARHASDQTQKDQVKEPASLSVSSVYYYL
jgi:hypothetical protein